MSAPGRFQLPDKRILIIAFFTLYIALMFWSGSRIPALNEKAMMGGQTQLEALGFDQVFQMKPDDGYLKKVLITTVNWIDTNKKGMTFGVTLAACLMTLLSLFQRKSFNNGFGNALIGILIGTPLGVCVNCAAPIAKGLHSAGTRIETTLATMTSSPTFNVIVVTILFSLFPWYIVATKLGFTFLLIAVGIPLMCKFLFSREEIETIGTRVEIHEDGEVCELPTGGAACTVDTAPQGWLESIIWVVPTFLRTLWYIVKTTVPLMFMAGLLGALFIVAIPWDMVTGSLPEIEGSVMVLAAMIGLALFGVFLPVPIAFDIVVVAILMAAGLPIHFVMVLLFTLGIFSIYSFSVVWNHISRKAAVFMFLMVAAFGVIAGVAAHYIEGWEADRQHETMVSLLLDPNKLIQPAVYDKAPGVDDSVLVGELRANASVAQPVVQLGGGEIVVSHLPYSDSGTATGQFKRVQGPAIGVDSPAPYSLNRLNPPVHWSRGISTGDVHNDGWPDILMAADKVTYRGISLFANRGGQEFVEQAIDIPIIAGLRIVNAVLVDINNDGWKDIFVASYRGGNYIIFNNEGRFHADNLYHLPDNGAAVAAAVAFGDIDEDGDLDIVLGNWALGMFRLVMPGEPANARNQLLIQENGEFTPRDLKRYPGETLTMLMTDFDGDNNLDLIVGNEFEASDIFYRGDGNGGLEEIVASDGVIPHTISSSMSIASADLDNDLKPEIYLGQITTGVGAGFARQMRTPDAECDYLADDAERGRCLEFMEINTSITDSRPKQAATSCLDIDDPLMRQDCMALHVLWRAWMEKDKSYCEMIPSFYNDYSAICFDMFKPHIEPTQAERDNQIQQVTNFNVLLSGDMKSGYQDKAKDVGLHITGWTWNANFADVDNDEWIDLYVANGRVPSNKRESNFFFRNLEGQFENYTEQYNLIDFRASSVFSYVDFDRDGDIDIISVPATAPVQIYVNQINDANGFTVELRDRVGNYNGVGSKVYVAYGAGGERKQMREIQMSGGFLSFNEAVAHFGLGDYDEVTSIEVQWSTGEKSVIDGPFEANGRYIIERRSESLAAIESAAQ